MTLVARETARLHAVRRHMVDEVTLHQERPLGAALTAECHNVLWLNPLKTGAEEERAVGHVDGLASRV